MRGHEPVIGAPRGLIGPIKSPYFFTTERFNESRSRFGLYAFQF
jgi:hypothetical protein